MTIEIPDWCLIGKTIQWSARHYTGRDWVEEKIIAFGYSGFFHQAKNCPIYFTEFSEYGKTVREVNV